MIKKTAAILLLLCASAYCFIQAYTIYTRLGPTPKVVELNPDVIVLEGTIYKADTIGLFRKKAANIVKAKKKLVNLVRGGAGEVHIKINSGGGLMDPGMKFVHTMRAAQYVGVRFICVVDGRAMSMALIIFSECDERYATFGSEIMWHSIAMIGRMHINDAKAREMLSFFEIKNEEVWAKTRNHFWPWYFTKHFRAETKLDVSVVEKESFGYLKVIRNTEQLKYHGPLKKDGTL